MSVYSLLKKDKRVRRLRRMVKNGVYAVNTIEFNREMEAMHATRATRKLTVSDVLHKFQSQFLKAVLQNQANRSRVVEIKMRCFRTNARLDKHIKKLREHLMMQYANQLGNIAKTKAERESIVNNLFTDAIDVQEEIKTTMAIADILIADIDQTGWSIKHLMDAVQIVQEKGKTI